MPEFDLPKDYATLSSADQTKETIRILSSLASFRGTPKYEKALTKVVESADIIHKSLENEFDAAEEPVEKPASKPVEKPATATESKELQAAKRSVQTLSQTVKHAEEGIATVDKLLSIYQKSLETTQKIDKRAEYEEKIKTAKDTVIKRHAAEKQAKKNLSDAKAKLAAIEKEEQEKDKSAPKTTPKPAPKATPSKTKPEDPSKTPKKERTRPKPEERPSSRKSKPARTPKTG